MKARLVKSILHLTAHLPLPMVHLMGALVGLGLLLLPNKTRTIAATNITLCFPELDARGRKRLLRQNLIETAKTFAETGIFWLGRPARFQKLIKEVVGEKHLEAALAQGKGAIIIAPHIGNWEIVGLYCSGRYPMTSMYRPPRLAELDVLIRAARQRYGATLVPTNAQGVKGLLQALKRNELIGILPDQDPKESGGHFAPFFGVQANTMVLLSRLAQKSQAPTLLVYAERLAWGRGFRLHFVPGPTAINDRDMERSVAAVNALVEQAARAIPAQYLWSYKRFKTRPPGEPEIY